MKSLLIYSLVITVAIAYTSAAPAIDSVLPTPKPLLKSTNPVDSMSGWINGIFSGIGVPKWG